MADRTRWGIVGTGKIAKLFAPALKALPDAELVAVGSRTRDGADAFGDAYGVPRRHASYEDLAADADVDVVYVATPHPFHKDNTLLCLRAGKAVLCEKPFAVNAAEAREMVACARRKGLFLMEAMWTRFLPVIRRVGEWVAAELIGKARVLTADFGYRCPGDPRSRAMAPELAGGGLLDVGVYPISLAYMLFGRPIGATGLAHLGPTGVDEQAGLVLSWPGGEIALLACAVRTTTAHVARIDGTAGRIEVPDFWHATKATLWRDRHAPQTFERPHFCNGYEYEAQEVMECLRAGGTESRVMPLDESLAIMETLDALRAQWGLRYPMEADGAAGPAGDVTAIMNS